MTVPTVGDGGETLHRAGRCARSSEWVTSAHDTGAGAGTGGGVDRGRTGTGPRVQCRAAPGQRDRQVRHRRRHRVRHRREPVQHPARRGAVRQPADCQDDQRDRGDRVRLRGQPELDLPRPRANRLRPRDGTVLRDQRRRPAHLVGVPGLHALPARPGQPARRQHQRQRDRRRPGHDVPVLGVPHVGLPDRGRRSPSRLRTPRRASDPTDARAPASRLSQPAAAPSTSARRRSETEVARTRPNPRTGRGARCRRT